MRIGLLTIAPFPVGNVSTIRFTSYLEALSNLGIYTKVIIYSPTTMAKEISSSKGVYRGIEYEYATRITWGKCKNYFVKAYYLLIGLFSSLKIIHKNKIDTIILYGDNLFIVNAFLWIYRRLFSCRFIGDRSELPTLQQRQSKIRHRLYRLKYSLLDGIIVMTRQLENYYKEILKKEDACFLLPMTTDIHRFDQAIKVKTDEPYIAVVFGVHNRDGLHESLLSYFEYKRKGGNYIIKLIGDFYSMPNCDELLKLISESNYKVEILGQLPINEVPQYLYNASCLLTTPNYYISGGFPTKLGEYMLSEVPVIATKVGELPNYIQDNYDIIFAEAGNVTEIASKLLWVENNKVAAAKIAQQAKVTAIKVFSAETYAQDIITFFNKI